MSSFKFLLAAIGTGVVIYLAVSFGISSGWFSRPTLLPEIVLLNVVVTFILYRWLIRMGAQTFINGYLLSIVLKLIFYFGVLLTVRILSPQSLTANAILLMVCYAIFTILEVAILFLKVGR